MIYAGNSLVLDSVECKGKYSRNQKVLKGQPSNQEIPEEHHLACLLLQMADFEVKSRTNAFVP